MKMKTTKYGAQTLGVQKISRMRRFAKIIKSEVTSSFLTSTIYILIASSLFAFVTPMVAKIKPNLIASNYELATKQIISQFIGQLVTFALLIKTRTAFKDKTTLDKNRNIYLYYCKNQVLFAKLLADIVVFALPVASVSLLGISVIGAKEHAVVTAKMYGDTIYFLIGVIFIYLLTTFGLRIIITKLSNKGFRTLAVSAWILFTVGTYLVLGVTSAVVVDDQGNRIIADFMVENKYIFAFVPLFNIVIPQQVMSGNIDAIFALPLIIETLIFIIVFWRMLATNLKTYLTV